MAEDLPLGVKLIAGLYALGGIIAIGGSLFFTGPALESSEPLLILAVLALFLVGVAGLVAAYGLFRRERWGFYLAVALLVLDLTVGTGMDLWRGDAFSAVLGAVFAFLFLAYLGKHRDIFLATE